jgi:hypothetical protein
MKQEKIDELKSLLNTIKQVKQAFNLELRMQMLNAELIVELSEKALAEEASNKKVK